MQLMQMTQNENNVKTCKSLLMQKTAADIVQFVTFEHVQSMSSCHYSAQTIGAPFAITPTVRHVVKRCLSDTRAFACSRHLSLKCVSTVASLSTDFILQTSFPIKLPALVAELHLWHPLWTDPINTAHSVGSFGVNFGCPRGIRRNHGFRHGMVLQEVGVDTARKLHGMLVQQNNPNVDTLPIS